MSRVASWEEYFFFSLPSFPTHQLGLLCYGCFGIAVSRVASWEEYFFFVAFFSYPSVGFVVLWLFWYSCVESCFLGRVFFFRCLLFLPINWVCCVMAVFGIAVSRVASWEEYFFFVAFFSYPSVGFVVLWLFWYSCVESWFQGRVFIFSLPSFPTHQLGLLCYGCFWIAVSRVASWKEYFFFSLPSFPTHQLGLLCYGCFGIAVSRVASWEEYFFFRCLLFLPISWVFCVIAVFG